MYKSIADFKKDWNDESEATIRLFKALTDDSLSVKVYSEGRNIGFIAWHITQTLGEMLGLAGLKIDNFDHNQTAPNSLEEIYSKYQQYSKQLIDKIDEWNDEMLNDEIDMYGQIWQRSNVLKGLVYHQIHHRGQITVLMRQAGLKVPGLYGPSKEEWSQIGMAEQL